MSRFAAPDLSSLPDLPLDDPEFATIVSARLADYRARAIADGVEYDVGELLSDPITIAQEVGADRELELHAKINDDVRLVMLVTSWGAGLDHIAATYYGISRLIVTPATDTDPAVMELDDDFRARIALAPEAFSTAGPEGAYLFHTLELDGLRDIADAAVYSMEDAATYSVGLNADAYSRGLRSDPFLGRADGDPVLAPEVLIVIVPTLAYGAVDQPLLDRAFDAATAKEVRPKGDNVRIEPATDIQYSVVGKIRIKPGADATLLLAEAQSRVEKYTAARRRVGRMVQLLGLGGAMKVTDVEEIEITSPAADIDPGSKGVATVIDITLTAEISEDTWH